VNLVKKARKRSAAPFVNAVLRKLAAGASSGSRESHSINSESAETLAVSSAHPQWLVERWVHEYGLDSAAHICEYDQSRPIAAIRLRRPEAEDRLGAEGIELAAGALLASARRVLLGDVTQTPAFRAGLCVIQDEASQLVAALVGNGSRILDCCAAPGGKTSAIADRNPTASISATELHPHRARLLRQLLRAPNGAIDARSPNIKVTAADARELPFSTKFDRVLADVPCSGTGTLSRNPEIKWRLSAKDFADLQTRQLAILRSSMDRVAIGGRLVYSTCSLEREENEDVIERALAQNSSFRLIDCRVELERLQKDGELVWRNLPSLTRGSYLRTLPGVHPCDGFFAAILQNS
jgi:16S rRNA (cytosine967-C5)-methyltransferase